MTLSVSSCPSGASPPQSNMLCTTTERGASGAESVPSGAFGSSAAAPFHAGRQVRLPVIARPYGSSSNFAGLHRDPDAGSHGPCTRNP